MGPAPDKRSTAPGATGHSTSTRGWTTDEGGTAFRMERHANTESAETYDLTDDLPASDLVTTETFHPPLTTAAARPRAAVEGPWRRHPLSRIDWAIALLLVGLALTARRPFVQVGETLLDPDEGVVGQMALDIRAGERFPIYFYGQRYMGALEAYIIAGLLPFFDSPVQALRFGPALVFSVFVGLQFLMLTRWFGRSGGMMGALTAIACSPMMAHWSVSARGGYIEVILWGTALLWAYSEWFVESAASTRRRRLLFGALLGSGFWINPSIVLFIAPIVVHALLHRPMARLQAAARLGSELNHYRVILGRGALPIAAILGVLTVNAIWSVWVDEGQVHYSMLFGLGPSSIAFAAVGASMLAVAWFLFRRTRLIADLRSLATANAAMILGIVLGATPAIAYLIQTTLKLCPLDPSLPLGLRPLWETGETLIYLGKGLPVLFMADPRPFVQLMGIGRPDVSRPLDLVMSAAVTGADWLVLGACATSAMILIRSQRSWLSRIFRLQSHVAPPVGLLMIAVGTTIGLFIVGGCVMNFTTIRYLVPLCAFLPGLWAAVWIDRLSGHTGKYAVAAVCAAYCAGQVAMIRQLGAPHPLRPVADALMDKGIDHGIAEPLDAHLLGLMTSRKCRLAEFESFWVRLPQNRRQLEIDAPVDYIVETPLTDWTAPWTQAGWPGWPPPQTLRFLWPRLQRAIANDPSNVVLREPLGGGYERIRLRKPIPERQF